MYCTLFHFIFCKLLCSQFLAFLLFMKKRFVYVSASLLSSFLFYFDFFISVRSVSQCLFQSNYFKSFYLFLLFNLIYLVFIRPFSLQLSRASSSLSCSVFVTLYFYFSAALSLSLSPSIAVPFSLSAELSSEHVTTRVAAIKWIKMLHVKDSKEINKSISSLLPSLLKTVSDTADEVILVSLQILALISSERKQFLKVINALILLFFEDRILLETRGALVIRKLCVLLDCRSVYLSIADILNNFHHLEFIGHMVQTLNLILLTAPELIILRKSLKNCFENYKIKNNHLTSTSQKLIKHENIKKLIFPSDSNMNNSLQNDIDDNVDKNKNSSTNNNNAIHTNNNNNNDNDTNSNNNNNNNNNNDNDNDSNPHEENDSDLFIALFSSWCHNPVATFSLCLLSQAYNLSSKLILRFAEVDVTVGFLMQIDKLIQLIESPVFINLRLQLLEVTTKHHNDLLKSLYGLLMVRLC